MTANPVELIGGIATTANVPKADVVAWAKARVIQVLADVTEVRNTLLAAQVSIFLRTFNSIYLLDAADTTTADDGVTCVVSLDGKRFKPFPVIPATLTDLTRAAAIATVIPAGVLSIRTTGYAKAGDGGSALHKRVTSLPAGMYGFQSADGAWWQYAEPVMNVIAFGAVRNYGFKGDISMAAGSTTALSPSGWLASDVGKYIIVDGAGATGLPLVTTIASYTDSTHVALGAANASGGAVSGKSAEYGTDDAPAFQAAWNMCVAQVGGHVYAPLGHYLVSQLNMTNANGQFIIKGAGPDCTVIHPLQIASYGTVTGHLFDMAGSSFIGLESLQIGSFNTVAKPTTAIFMAQTLSGTSNRISLNNLYVSGKFNGSTLYNYAVGSLYTIQNCDFYNYAPGAGFHNCLTLTSSNINNYTSAFATVKTGTLNCSDILFVKCEFHKFAGAGADNSVILLDFVGNVQFISGVLSGGASYYVSLFGATTNLGFINVSMETEGEPVVPSYAYYVNTGGTISRLQDSGSSYIYTLGLSQVTLTTQPVTYYSF